MSGRPDPNCARCGGSGEYEDIDGDDPSMLDIYDCPCALAAGVGGVEQ